jgi:hypothetical protein
MISVVAFKFDDFLSLPLNSLGDFLAGVFSPIAFLWLVLGFLQQGDELKQGTDALRLQASELNASVSQQAAMVEVARQQLNAAVLTAEHERLRYEVSLEPDISISSGGVSSRDLKDGFILVFSNKATPCTRLVITLNHRTQGEMELGRFDYLGSEALEVFIPLRAFQDSSFEPLICSYTTAANVVSWQFFSLALYGEEGSRFLSISKKV